MMSGTGFRAARHLSSQVRLSARTFAVSARQLDSTTAVATPKAETAPQTTDPSAQPTEALQAPNRADVWARSQKPRSKAMTGPRFEQTDFSLQVSAHCRRVGLPRGCMHGIETARSREY